MRRPSWTGRKYDPVRPTGHRYRDGILRFQTHFQVIPRRAERDDPLDRGAARRSSGPDGANEAQRPEPSRDRPNGGVSRRGGTVRAGGAGRSLDGPARSNARVFHPGKGARLDRYHLRTESGGPWQALGPVRDRAASRSGRGRSAVARLCVSAPADAGRGGDASSRSRFRVRPGIGTVPDPGLVRREFSSRSTSPGSIRRRSAYGTAIPAAVERSGTWQIAAAAITLLTLGLSGSAVAVWCARSRQGVGVASSIAQIVKRIEQSADGSESGRAITEGLVAYLALMIDRPEGALHARRGRPRNHAARRVPVRSRSVRGRSSRNATGHSSVCRPQSNDLRALGRQFFLDLPTNPPAEEKQ